MTDGPTPNRAARRAQILATDGRTCVWCGREVAVGLVGATTEHLVPKVKGGPSWAENEVVACARCNRSRGHVTPAEWLTQCELLGQPADRDRIIERLRALLARIEREGGQRRARRYAHSQLRRLTR